MVFMLLQVWHILLILSNYINHVFHKRLLSLVSCVEAMLLERENVSWGDTPLITLNTGCSAHISYTNC